MNIILEGPDSSGKSTLALAIRKAIGAYGYNIKPGEGPPGSPEEMIERIDRYLWLDYKIFDRHPLVSQPIYGALRGDPNYIPDRFFHVFYRERSNLFVYCRTTVLRGHDVKDGENPDHIAALTANFNLLVETYDKWALQRARLIYDRDRDDPMDVAQMIRGLL